MFPKRDYQKVAVNHITDLNDLRHVAKRFMIASEYAAEACALDRVIVLYPTVDGVISTEMRTDAAYSFLRGAARLGDLLAEITKLDQTKWGFQYLRFCKYEANQNVIDDARYAAIYGGHLRAFKMWLANDARKVLWSHNADISFMVRSNCAVKAVAS